MSNRSNKKKLARCVIALLAVVAVIVAGFFIIPVSVLPAKYDQMECFYISIDGKVYRPEDGYPSEEQVQKIEKVLKQYTMNHTASPFTSEANSNPQIYIVMKFKDSKGVITDSKGIRIYSDGTANTRSKPFYDLVCKINNGKALSREIKEILQYN